MAKAWVEQRNHNGLYSHVRPGADVYWDRRKAAQMAGDNLELALLSRCIKNPGDNAGGLDLSDVALTHYYLLKWRAAADLKLVSGPARAAAAADRRRLRSGTGEE